MTKRYTFCAVLTALVLHTAVFAQKTVPSVALQKGTSLWNKKTEGMMEWAKIDLEAGTELVSYLSSEEGELPVALTEESSWTTAKNNQTMAFAKVQYQGKDYYVISNRVALDKQPAVVVQQAATYISSNMADVRKKSLPIGTVVAVAQESGNDSLIKASYYDEASYRVRHGWIRKNRVSSEKDDISTLKILTQARAEKDPARQKALFKSLEHLEKTSRVKELVQQTQDELAFAADLSSAGTIAEDKTLLVQTNDQSLLNIRSLPGLDGTVVAKVSDGTQLQSIEHTVLTQLLDGIEAPWYHVFGDDSEGKSFDGWIFGGYVLVQQ